MTVEEKIDDLLTRGVGTFIDPQGKFKEKLLKKAKREYPKEIIIKFGIDPTRPDIHLGHAVVLRKLRQFQDLGCKIIFLIGDFTALIGDPTGKSKSRPEIDQKEAERNISTYIKQITKILKIEPTNDKEKDEKIIRSNNFIVDSPWFAWIRNSDWFYGVTDISTEGMGDIPVLGIDKNNPDVETKIQANTFLGKAAIYDATRMQTKLLKKEGVRGVSLVNTLAVLRHISFSQLIERDMFQKRINDKEPLFMHEMMYPVFQGIDSDVIAEVYGTCDLEVGGTDQTFNMLMGRKVMELTKKEPQAVISFEILVGLDGKEKMSKSLDNYVGITDEPNDMFGKIMSIPDDAVIKYFELCTYTPALEVKKIEIGLEANTLHPMDVKKDLAQQIVEIYHGRESASVARETFSSTFQKKEIPDDIEEVAVGEDKLIVDLLVRAKVVASKSEWRRLVEEGAAKRLSEGNEEKITNANEEALPGVYKIGKRRFIKIVS